MKGVFTFKIQVYQIPRMGPLYVCTHLVLQISFIKVFSQLFHIFKNSRNRKNTLLVLLFVSENYGNITQGLQIIFVTSLTPKTPLGYTQLQAC